jgi:hypothetical protein
MTGLIAKAKADFQRESQTANDTLKTYYNPDTGSIVLAKTELDTYINPVTGLIAKVKAQFQRESQMAEDTLDTYYNSETGSIVLAKGELDTYINPETGFIVKAEMEVNMILADGRRKEREFTDPKTGSIPAAERRLEELTAKFKNGFVSSDDVFTAVKYAWECRKCSATEMLNILSTMYDRGLYNVPGLHERARNHLGIDLKTRDYVKAGDLALQK